MTTLYLLFWARDMALSFNYGSQIQFFPDDWHVNYENHLASPGIRLHSWQSSYNYGQQKQNLDLPLLMPKTDYVINFNVSGDPKQMYTAVDYFAGEETLPRTNLAALPGEFQVPEEADRYRISLVNIHQVSFSFYYGLLMRKTDSEKYDVLVDAMNRVVIITRKDRDKIMTQAVTLIHRDNATKPLIIGDEDRTVVLFGTNWEWRDQDWQKAAQAYLVKALQPIPAEMRKLPIRFYGPGLADFAQAIGRQAAANYQITPILA